MNAAFNLDLNERFVSRRSPVIAARAAVATSQPLATEAGIHILRHGGGAADAAVAVAAMLQVAQPCSTGLGGDAFWLYWDARARSVAALNGSGRAPAALTLETARAAAVNGQLPNYHPYTVTVPGAAAAWQDLLDRFGRLSRSQVVAPALSAAAQGFPVAPATARWWAAGAERQLRHHEHGAELMVRDPAGAGSAGDAAFRAPRAGELFRNPALAEVLAAFASDGANPFYHGWIAERIVAVLEREGGVMSRDDLAAHKSEPVTPLSLPFAGHRVWECPPNGHGLAALIALGIYERAGATTPEERLHAQVEAMRLAFADTSRYLADPEWMSQPPEAFLSQEYLSRRAACIDLKRRLEDVHPGSPQSTGTDTVYFAVRDAEGNACSFINSNYMGFGTGIVPRGCGFSLQNRGRGFVLDPDHPNAPAPGKRPYHTIIPGMITCGSRQEPALHAVFGVMGGMMQPQGHLQVASSLLEDRLDPQSALDRHRFQLENGEPDGKLLVEAGMDETLVDGLRTRGHRLELVDGAQRAAFGLGQVLVDASGPGGATTGAPAEHVQAVWAGSDPRGDGCALGF